MLIGYVWYNERSRERDAEGGVRVCSHIKMEKKNRSGRAGLFDGISKELHLSAQCLNRRSGTMAED